MRYRLLLPIVVVFLLVGCKADEIELRISTKELLEVLQGGAEDIRFQAEFTLLAEYDDELKATITQIDRIANRHVEIEEFDVTSSDFGLKIELEGTIPLLFVGENSGQISSKSPWVVAVANNPTRGTLKTFPHVLIFSASTSLQPFLAELQGVNFMLTPDKFQPVKFRLRNNADTSLRIFTAGVEVDNETRVVYESTVDGRTSLTMKGGVYNRAPPMIFFDLREQ